MRNLCCHDAVCAPTFREFESFLAKLDGVNQKSVDDMKLSPIHSQRRGLDLPGASPGVEGAGYLDPTRENSTCSDVANIDGWMALS